MIENKLELEIISLYDSNLLNLLSIKQIAKKLNKKYPYINKKVTELLKEGILKKIVVGKSYLCSLNFENNETVLLLSLLEFQKKRRLDVAEIEEWIKQNMLRMTTHCVVYHKNKHVFVVENLRDRRELQKVFKDCVVVDKREFLDLLCEEQELFTKHTVIYGVQRFFELLTTELDELKRIHSPLKY